MTGQDDGHVGVDDLAVAAQQLLDALRGYWASPTDAATARMVKARRRVEGLLARHRASRP